MHKSTPLVLPLYLVLAATAVADPSFPPSLPNGETIVTFTGEDLLEPPGTFKSGNAVAETPPVVDFMYYPGQDYPGRLWSVWGDSLAVGEKYYSSIGDHDAPEGNAFVYEYDPDTKSLRRIVDVRSILNMPPGHYTPGKIHSRLDLGSDGWLYFSTHRGSTRTTVPENHYTGDWILRHNPETGESEVVVHAPLPNQCLPTGRLDPDRLIFYAGTANGDRTVKRVMFLAYDVNNHEVVYSDDHGPYRYILFARSTGRVYFQQGGGRGQVLPLVRFDPDHPGPPQLTTAEVGLRACTVETPDRLVYTVDGDNLWEFNTETETARRIGETIVGEQEYIASIDIDPHTWRYLYYVPGAHGGGYRDGAPLIQYDLETNTRKVIAFLHPACYDRTGYVCMGTYGLAVSPGGETVYITWNGNEGTPRSELATTRLRMSTCGLTVVHVPESERMP
jgi:hypothetical protein